jgi:hypothetical protein
MENLAKISIFGGGCPLGWGDPKMPERVVHVWFHFGFNVLSVCVLFFSLLVLQILYNICATRYVSDGCIFLKPFRMLLIGWKR